MRAGWLLPFSLAALSSHAPALAAEPAAAPVVPAQAAAPAPPSVLPCIGQGVAAIEGLPPEQAIAEARKALEQLDYERALALVKPIGAQAPPALRVQALEIAATVELVVGRAAVAQPLLEELYFLAPAFLLEDPSLPPRVTEMFDEEAARPHARAIKLDLVPAGLDRRAFAIRAGGAATKVVLDCRAGARGPFLPLLTSFSLPAGSARGRARFRLPNEGAYQCYAVARDRDGLPLGRLGTKAAPIPIASRPAPPAPPPEPVWRRWYFWTSIGAAVTGGVIAAAIVATRKQELPAADITIEAPAAQAASIVRW